MTMINIVSQFHIKFSYFKPKPYEEKFQDIENQFSNYLTLLSFIKDEFFYSIS